MQKKKTNPAAHLNVRTQENATQESSERAGGADSSMQVSHADSIMKLCHTDSSIIGIYLIKAGVATTVVRNGNYLNLSHVGNQIPG